MNAADLMTENPMTAEAQMSLREAVEVLQQMQVRHLPVVTRTGELVGMLSDRDVRNSGRPYTLREGQPDTSEATVVDVMSTDVVTVTPETDLNEIIDLIIEHRIGAVPVVDPGTGNLVGIVSYIDVLREVRE